MAGGSLMEAKLRCGSHMPAIICGRYDATNDGCLQGVTRRRTQHSEADMQEETTGANRMEGSALFRREFVRARHAINLERMNGASEARAQQ